MLVEEIIAAILAGILGCLFFFADLFNQKVNINPSLIAGMTVSYFFLVVLPEIAGEQPILIFGLPALEYVFILVGVATAHFLEKFILQHVEARAREKAEEIANKTDLYNELEDRMAIAIANGIENQKLEKDMVLECVSALKKMIEKERGLRKELDELKRVLHDHVNERLEEFHDITEFIYHIIIGIILSGLLLVNIPEAILFFIIAVLMVTVSHKNSRQRIFVNLDIELDYVETKRKRVVLALAAPIGLSISITLQLTLHINLELIYLLFSFIAGALLYIIMREVIPEKERGHSIFFAVGLLGFSAIVIILNAFNLAF